MGVARGSRDCNSDVISTSSAQLTGMLLFCSTYIPSPTPWYIYPIPGGLPSVDQSHWIFLDYWVQRSRGRGWGPAGPATLPVGKPLPLLPLGYLGNTVYTKTGPLPPRGGLTGEGEVGEGHVTLHP